MREHEGSGLESSIDTEPNTDAVALVVYIIITASVSLRVVLSQLFSERSQAAFKF